MDLVKYILDKVREQYSIPAELTFHPLKGWFLKAMHNIKMSRDIVLNLDDDISIRYDVTKNKWFTHKGDELIYGPENGVAMMRYLRKHF